MKLTGWMTMLAGLCFSASLWPQAVAVPQLINYQGKLTVQNAENPLPTAEYQLTFNIYDGQDEGANLIWGPQVFAQVPVVQGFFNVILGPQDAGGGSIASAFLNQNRYLEIQIDSDPPISPRQQILSAPYALQAAGSVPIGGVIPWFDFSGSSSIPDPSDFGENWRLCDGKVIADTDSPLNGESTPNLINQILRGNIIISTSSPASSTEGRPGQEQHESDSSVLTASISSRSLESRQVESAVDSSEIVDHTELDLDRAQADTVEEGVYTWFIMRIK